MIRLSMIFFIFLCSCTSGNKKDNKKPNIVNDFISNGWIFEIPKEDSQLISRFGPKFSKTGPRVFAFDRRLKTLHYSFNDIDITWLLLPKNKKVIKLLRVRSPSFKFKYGVQVGRTKNYILNTLGKPYLLRQKTFSYISTNIPARLFINFDSFNKVESISVSPLGSTIEGFKLISN